MTESVYDQVHREYLEHGQDPAYRMAMEIYLGELVGEIANYHQAHIQAVADQAALRQIHKAKSQITKMFLANRLLEIRKSTKEDFKEGNWVREHGKFARYVGPGHAGPHYVSGGGVPQHPGSSAQDYHSVVRDELGRLSFEQQTKPHNVVGYLAKPVEVPVELSDAEHKAEVLRINAELVHDLENKTRDPRNKQRVQFLVTNPSGHSRIITPAAGNVPQQGKERHQIDWEGGERVQYMTPVGPDQPVMVAGHALNIGHVMGASPEQSAKLGSVAQDIHDVLTSTSWGKKLQAAANAARLISDEAPVFTQAHAVAQLVNLVGPDAARAFGPKLRQLTYRYSGQEAPHDQWSEAAQKGRQKNESIRGFENRLGEDLRSSLPTRREYAASLQAGTTPPSRGYIVDRNGKVVSEAVGFSDDWYTPFNLSKLPNLKGGSYVRSRGYGGITPEDLRLAMRTGAKRVTVISNNGTFTLEFEPKALSWGHRFGFGGAAMIRRYTKSLDAIKGNQVEDPETGQKLTLNSKGYLAAMHDLKMKFPFWITDQRMNGIPYFEPGRGPEAQGDHDDKEGYVAPLGIKAQGAQAGYAESGHRELWTDANGNLNTPPGKFAYDSHQRYQLHSNLADQVIRDLGGGTASTTSSSSTSSAPKPTTSWGSQTAQSAGAVKTERAYPTDEKLHSQQMDSILAALRRVMRQNEELDSPASTGQTTYLAELEPYLNVEGSIDFKDSGYRELADKLAANPDIRKELAEEIGDTYKSSKLASSVSELLPRLATETADDEAEGAKAAADNASRYTEKDHIPYVAVRESPLVKRTINALRVKADDGDSSAKQVVGQFDQYMELLSERDGARRNGRAYPQLTESEQKVYSHWNKQVAGLLNMERERSEDEGDHGDDGARTSAKGKMVAFTNEHYAKMLDRSNTPEDIAQDILADAMSSSEDEGEQQNYAVDAVGQLHHRATWHRNKGEDGAARRITEIANTLADKAEEMASYQQMMRQQRNPNA